MTNRPRQTSTKNSDKSRYPSSNRIRLQGSADGACQNTQTAEQKKLLDAKFMCYVGILGKIRPSSVAFFDPLKIYLTVT